MFCSQERGTPPGLWSAKYPRKAQLSPVSPMGLSFLSSGPALYSRSSRPLFPRPPPPPRCARGNPSSLGGSCPFNRVSGCPLSVSWGHGLATQASNEIPGRQLCYLPSETSQSCSMAQAGCHLLVHYCGTLGLRQIDPEACSRLPVCYCGSGKLLNLSPLKPQLSNLQCEDVSCFCQTGHEHQVIACDLVLTGKTCMFSCLSSVFARTFYRCFLE